MFGKMYNKSCFMIFFIIVEYQFGSTYIFFCKCLFTEPTHLLGSLSSSIKFLTEHTMQYWVDVWQRRPARYYLHIPDQNEYLEHICLALQNSTVSVVTFSCLSAPIKRLGLFVREYAHEISQQITETVQFSTYGSDIIQVSYIIWDRNVQVMSFWP